MKITLAAWAKKNGISRQVAHEWYKSGRVAVENPAQGILLIDQFEKRPVKMRPWERLRKDRLERERIY
jgi:predicted site-specific integrase-resolvase